MFYCLLFFLMWKSEYQYSGSRAALSFLYVVKNRKLCWDWSFCRAKFNYEFFPVSAETVWRKWKETLWAERTVISQQPPPFSGSLCPDSPEARQDGGGIIGDPTLRYVGGTERLWAWKKKQNKDPNMWEEHQVQTNWVRFTASFKPLSQI